MTNKGSSKVTISLQDCIDFWNFQADESNQWEELDADERCEWCLELANQRMEQLREFIQILGA